MRLLMLLALCTLAGCGDTPASLGITGPGTPTQLPPPPDDPGLGNPGVPDTGGGYGPRVGPTQSGGRYFNYN